MDPPLSAVRAVDPAELASREGMRVRIQLLDSGGGHQDLARWPTEVRTIDLRYRDLPDRATLRVPTLAAFAAMKTIAWADRHTARDLYDLARIAGIGGLTRDVATQVRQAAGWSVLPGLFSSLPPMDWTAQLGHQTATLPTAEQCLIDVHQAFATALDWPSHHRQPRGSVRNCREGRPAASGPRDLPASRRARRRSGLPLGRRPRKRQRGRHEER